MISLKQSHADNVAVRSKEIIVEGAILIHQIQNKNEVPEMKDINRYVKIDHAACWRNIGTELGLSYGRLDIIEADEPKCEARFQNMIKKWIDLNGHNATWKVLEVALTNVNRKKMSLDHVDDVYVPPVIEKLSEDLCCQYEAINELQEEEWLYQTKFIVNVTVIHYKNKQAKQEQIKVTEEFKTGASAIGKLVSSPPSQCIVTKDISEIFKIDTSDETESKPPKRILIEGSPGIGKTVLAKQIAYLWSDHKLLEHCKLVILVHLLDSKVHTMKSVKELLQLYTTEKEATEVNAYLEKTMGQDVAFVFDGYDEFPTSQEDSIIKNIIQRTKNGSRFQRSIVVITSRPSATFFLHKVVDRRIEILGFAPEERDELISRSILQLPHSRVQFEKYFEQHPIISSLCYIPLNLAIVLNLFEEESFPTTLTEINESFITHTICRHLKRKSFPIGCINHIKEMPKKIGQIFIKLAKLAFDKLQSNEFVFTKHEVENTCPEIFHVPEAANGFSLLRAVQHKFNTSFSFLHLTIQEYLAAYYVSTLPEEQQLQLLQEIFWDDRFNFMWIMYTGTIGVNSSAFISFIRTMNIKQTKVTSANELYDVELYDDEYYDEMMYINRFFGYHKLIEQIKPMGKTIIPQDNSKYLHLFQCYMEARDEEEPQVIPLLFNNGEVSLSGTTLLSYHITSLLHFMSISSIKQWKRLELNQCNLQRSEMTILLQNTINNKKMSTLEYVDLSENSTSPWGVYCAIIRLCCIDNLTLCGDNGINQYAKEISDSLLNNKTLTVLTLLGFGKAGVETIKTFMVHSLPLKRLYLSWKKIIHKNQITVMHKPSSSTSNAILQSCLQNDDKTCITVLCGKYVTDYDPKSITFSDEKINNDALHVLAFGLCYNTTIVQLNISNSYITDEGAVILIDCLKYNEGLKKLDLSQNTISIDGMQKILGIIERQRNKLLLEYVDLSKNQDSQGVSSSPWGVYDAIIRCCCVNSITLCGDERMNKYIINLTDSLQANPALHSLTLLGIGKIGVESIKAILINNNTIKKLNLSWETIKNIHTESKILMRTYCSPHSQNVTQIDLPVNETHINRVVNINILYEGNLGHTQLHSSLSDIRGCRLNTVNLHGKRIGINDLHPLFPRIGYPRRRIDDTEIKIPSFSDIFSTQSHSSQTAINLANKCMVNDSIHVLAFGLCNNTTVEELNISNNEIEDDEAITIFENLKNNITLKKLNLSQNRVSNNGMNRMLEYINCQMTTLISLQYVDLSKNYCLQGVRSSPWGIYSAIIRHCCVDSLTLVGDEGMNEYIKEITESLQKNVTLYSLKLCSIGKMGVESIKIILTNTFTLKRLDLAWQNIDSKDAEVVLMYALFSSNTAIEAHNSDTTNGSVNISILCSGDISDSTDVSLFSLFDVVTQRLELETVIDLSDKRINDDAAHVLAFGLYYNTTLKELNVSCNNISDEGAIAVFDSLKYNKSLKKIDLSKNTITYTGMNKILMYIENQSTILSLEYLDLSKNHTSSYGIKGKGSSLWNVYCAIIRCCCVNNLTLCGDEKMNDCIKEIEDSLQANTKLQSLTLFDIGKIGIESIQAVLMNNSTLNELNLVWKKNNEKINNKFSLEHQPIKSKIHIKGIVLNGIYKVVEIKLDKDINHQYLTLQKRESKRFSLDGNTINGDSDAIYVLAFGLYHNRTLEELVIADRSISGEGIITIIDCLKHNITLRKLVIDEKISTDVTDRMIKNIESQGNTLSLEYVKLGNNWGTSPWGVYCAIIRNCCASNLTLCGDNGIEIYIQEIVDSLQTNTTLQSLRLHEVSSVHNLKKFEEALKYFQLQEESTKLYYSNISFSRNITDKDTDWYTVYIYSKVFSDEPTPKKINLSNLNLNDDNIIHFIKCNNTNIENLNISHNKITDNAIVAISDCLKFSSTLKELDLSQNVISIDGIKKMVEIIDKQVTEVSLEYVDLSENDMSPWGVYCAIIRHSCVNSLTLCGDKGMQKYINEINDSLKANSILQSLTLCNIGKVGVDVAKAVSLTKITLKILDLSWKKIKSTNKCRNNILIRNQVLKHNRSVKTSILYNEYICRYDEPKYIDSSTFIKENNDAVHLLVYGLSSNTTVVELNLPRSNITDEFALAIIDHLKHNKTLKLLNLSHNSISDNGMNRMLKNIEKQNTMLSLEYVDLSNNEYSSPWGVYCTIIRHCCVDSLTICGGAGTKKYYGEVTDSLQANTTLQSLTFFIVGQIGVGLIKRILMNNITLKRLNLSWIKDVCRDIYKNSDNDLYFLNIHDGLQNKFTLQSSNRTVEVNILWGINRNIATIQDYRSKTISWLSDRTLNVLAFGLHNNSTVEELIISCNQITHVGAITIFDCLKHNKTLKKIDMSINHINSYGMDVIQQYIEQKATTLSLEYVDLSKQCKSLWSARRYDSSSWGVYCAIIRHCCVSRLTLYGDEGMKKYINEIIESIQLNEILQLLTLINIEEMLAYNLKDALQNLNLSQIKNRNLKLFHISLYKTFDKRSEADYRIHSIFKYNRYTMVINCNVFYGSPTTINLSNLNINDEYVMNFMKHCKTKIEILNMSHNKISDNGIAAICECLKQNRTVKELDLSQNKININGMDKMLKYFENQQATILLEYVDFSGNDSSPWGVYCGIIRYSCVHSLTLCGDEGMCHYCQMISDSLQKNITLKSLTLYHIGKSGVESIKAVLMSNLSIKKLNLSWKKANSRGRERILTQGFFSPSNDNKMQANIVPKEVKRDMIISILYNNADDNHITNFSCSSSSTVVSTEKCKLTTTVIKLCDKRIDDDALHVLAFGLYNNTTVVELNISDNEITDEGVVTIINCLKHNKILKKLDLSQNKISITGMNTMLENVGAFLSLKYINLSKNRSSPWCVYCGIIRHCCVNSLTLSGDEGMKEYTKEITDSLQANTTLQSLVLILHCFNAKLLKTALQKFNLSQIKAGNKQLLYISCQAINTFGFVKCTIVINYNVLYDECSPTNVDLSGINIDDADVIHFIKCNNTKLEKLNLSCNNITDNGMVTFFNCVKHNETLKELDLSHNKIDINEFNKHLTIIESEVITLSLKYIDLSGNNSSPWGVYSVIIRHSCVSSLTLCGDEGMNEYIKAITDSVEVNTTLQSLTFLSVGETGVQSVKAVLMNIFTQKRLSLIWAKPYSKDEENMLLHKLFSPKQDKKILQIKATTKMTSNTAKKVAKIGILYDGNDSHLFYRDFKSKATITIDQQEINDDAVHVLAFGLCNNTTVVELNISSSNLTYKAAIAIFDCLKCNKTIKKLIFSRNRISVNEMTNIKEKIESLVTLLLEYVDLSGNGCSPWGVYCAIIRCCYVNSLTLCGAEGMEKYINEILGSLQVNATLQSLILKDIPYNTLEALEKAISFLNKSQTMTRSKMKSYENLRCYSLSSFYNHCNDKIVVIDIF